MKKLVDEYGKVRLLELVKKKYDLCVGRRRGLCVCLVRSLAYLLESKHKCQIIDLGYKNEAGETIPYYKAFREIFPQWCKEEAWRLTYTPLAATSEFDIKPDWYRAGYWWAIGDDHVRFEYLDKMIGIYKTAP